MLLLKKLDSQTLKESSSCHTFLFSMYFKIKPLTQTVFLRLHIRTYI